MSGIRIRPVTPEVAGASPVGPAKLKLSCAAKVEIGDGLRGSERVIVIWKMERGLKVPSLDDDGSGNLPAVGDVAIRGATRKSSRY